MRVLFLTHRLPYSPNRGDRLRAFHILRHLHGRAEVHLVSLAHDDEEAAHAADLDGLVASVQVARVPKLTNLARAALALPTARPVTHLLLDSPELHRAAKRVVESHRPDLVFAYCTGIAHLVGRPPLDGLPVVLDMVDVDSAKWAALAASARPPLSWVYAREARLLSRFERTISERAAATLLVTDKERATLEAQAPGARIHVIPNGVDVDALRPRDAPPQSATVVFCGVMNYTPNVEGAVWLASKVWPLVRRRRPDARLELVGADPSRKVLRLADEAAGIVVTGRVPDVRAYLWRAAVGVAPLLTARGVQNKVLEAVVSGLPTVVTPIVAEGVPAAVLAACVTASDAPAFADAIVAGLERKPAERRSIAARVDAASLTWDRALEPLDGILARAT